MDNEKTDLDTVAVPENADRALDLLREVREYQQEKEHERAIDTARVDGSLTHGEYAQGRPDPSLPQQLGRFEIIRRIGLGGFSTVYLANDPKLDRHVALKVPNPSLLLSSEARERFEREAKAAALLCHPDIVPVYEFGQIGPISFICYEFCAGMSLAEWLSDRGKPAQPRTAATVVARIAEAVQHAHQRGVIHRDLKPANVMVELARSAESNQPDPDSIDKQPLAPGIEEFISVRLTDFGLARNLGNEQQPLTIEGTALGTPAFMSPEQARGEKHLTLSTDIWSMGVILYQLLTNELPFQGDGYLAVMKAVENKSLVPPRTKQPSIPRDLDAICQKCLSKSPANRYASAFELEQDLKHWLDGRPVSARPVGRLQQLRRWSKRNPALSAALFFAFASLAIGLAVSSWKWREANHNLARATAETQRANVQTEIANKQTTRASRNLERVETVVDEVLSEIADGLENVPQFLPLRNRILDRVLEIQKGLLVEETGDKDIMLASIKANERIIRIYRLQGDEAQSLEAFEAARTLVRTTKTMCDDQELLEAKKLEVDLTLAFLVANYVAAFPVQSQQWLQEIQPIVVELEGHLAEHQVAALWCEFLWKRAVAHQTTLKFDEAEADYLSALLYSQKMIESSREEEGYFGEQSLGALVSQSYASLLGRMNRNAEAIELYQDFAANIEEQLAERPDRVDKRISLATVNFNLGNSFHRERNWVQAESYYSKAIELLDGILMIVPDSERVYRLLASSLQGQASSLGKSVSSENFAAIINSFERGVEIAGRLKNEVEKNLLLCVTHNNFGKFQWKQLKDYDSAISQYAATIALAEQGTVNWPEQSGFRKSLSIAADNLVDVYLESGDLESADTLVSWTLELSQTFLTDFPDDPEAKRDLAYVYASRCRVKAAQLDFEAVFDSANRLSEIHEHDYFEFTAAETLADCMNQLMELPADLITLDKETLMLQLEVEALAHLDAAVDAGFKNWQSLSPAHDEWDQLREVPRFREYADRANQD